MFENPEIAIETLPGTQTVQWQNLDPKFKRQWQVKSALMLLVAAVPLAFMTIIANIPAPPATILWFLWLLFFVFQLAWPMIAIPKRGYVVRDRDILFRMGVVWQSVTAIPFNRIQHVETSNTPLDRQFGLATLQLFTAGGSGGDLKIDGLEAGIAEQLRVYILRKVGTSVEHAE